MSRRLLLAGGGADSSGGGGGGPLPPDPTLTVERGVTQVTGVNQNRDYAPSGGITYRTEYRAAVDASTLRFAYGVHSQAIFDSPQVIQVTYEAADGTLTPLTFGGSTTLTLNEAESAESDEIAVTLGESQVFHLRTYAAAGTQLAMGITARTSTTMAGNALAGTWVPSAPSTAGPVPVAVIGKTRASVICPAMIGDSIAAQGIGLGGWWRAALTEHGQMPGLSYGRNARNFTALDGREGNTLRAATHVVVQYGANDLGSSPAVTALWANARANYAYVNTRNPGVPIYQTTCTPIVTTTDNCMTYANQTPYGSTRQAWNAFLRDGAPCDPTTKVALTPGATGLRMGESGHPLAGFIDVAAKVEQGGASAPTGKWLVIDGASWGGDGVHPDRAEIGMAEAVSEWLEFLSA